MGANLDEETYSRLRYHWTSKLAELDRMKAVCWDNLRQIDEQYEKNHQSKRWWIFEKN